MDNGTLAPREYTRAVLALHAAAHNYWRQDVIPKNNESSPVAMWRAMAVGAQAAMNASWLLAQHHAHTAAADPAAALAWATIAQRWTKSLETVIAHLATTEADTYWVEIRNWNALRDLPVVPSFGVVNGGSM